MWKWRKTDPGNPVMTAVLYPSLEYWGCHKGLIYWRERDVNSRLGQNQQCIGVRLLAFTEPNENGGTAYRTREAACSYVSVSYKKTIMEWAGIAQWVQWLGYDVDGWRIGVRFPTVSRDTILVPHDYSGSGAHPVPWSMVSEAFYRGKAQQ
jgi:hypothetical protein